MSLAQNTAGWPISLTLGTRLFLVWSTVSGLALTVVLFVHLQASQDRKAKQAAPEPPIASDLAKVASSSDRLNTDSTSGSAVSFSSRGAVQRVLDSAEASTGPSVALLLALGLVPLAVFGAVLGTYRSTIPNASLPDNERKRVLAALDAASTAIVILGKDARISDMNALAGEILNVGPGECKGRHISSLFCDDNRTALISAIEELSLKTSDVPIKLDRLIAMEGEVDAMLEVSLRSLQVDHFVLTVSKQEAFSEETDRVEELTQALERAKSELDEFAFIASHDLKAPLRVIENATQWLADDLDHLLTSDTRDSLALVQSRSARMRRFLDDLLSHSRICTTTPEGPAVSGEALIRSIIDELNVPDHIRIEVSKEMQTIRVQTCPLKMVLANLIENAVKHHDLGTATVNVGASILNDGYMFHVSDDGPGIAVEYQSKVFKLFQTLKSRDVMESSGLGLAMVRKQVELMGGSVTLVSDGVRGSTFMVEWPHCPKERVKMDRQS